MPTPLAPVIESSTRASEAPSQRTAMALLAQAFGWPPLSIEVEKQSDEIIIISPIMSRLKEGLEAQERELEAAGPALPPGAE